VLCPRNCVVSPEFLLTLLGTVSACPALSAPDGPVARPGLASASRYQSELSPQRRVRKAGKAVAALCSDAACHRRHRSGRHAGIALVEIGVGGRIRRPAPERAGAARGRLCVHGAGKIGVIRPVIADLAELHARQIARHHTRGGHPRPLRTLENLPRHIGDIADRPRVILRGRDLTDEAVGVIRGGGDETWGLSKLSP
jgi:hypothetical protein